MPKRTVKKTSKLKRTRPATKVQGRVLRSGKKKKTVKRIKPVIRQKKTDRLPLFLILLGLLLVGFWAVHRGLYYRSLSLSRAQVAKVISEEPKSKPIPTHIFIPWNTDADIEPLSLDDGNWQISDNKVTYLLNSARPGEAGNIILYGHNRREILGNIRALKGGEKITLTTSDGVKHEYLVKSVHEVEPDQLELLAPSKTEVLTLYTCSGFWDSLRFIVKALPEEK